MFADPTLWVFIALVVFIGILLWVKVPSLVTGKLDERSQRIHDELEEARRLKEDAMALLEKYKAHEAEAEQLAKEIVENANAEAERMKAAAEKQLKADIERRSEQAKQKIARAEDSAVAEIKATAADLARAAAAKTFEDRLSGAEADALIEKAIQQIPDKFKENA